VEEYKPKDLSLYEYHIPCLRQNVLRTEIILPTAATPILALVLAAIVVRIVEVEEVSMKLATCSIKHHATRRVGSGGTAPYIQTSTLCEDE
jgi:hypothetical protein